jgi:hypothetical protein
VTPSVYKKVYEAFRSKQPLHQTIYLLSAEVLRRFPLGSPDMSLVETLAQRLKAHVDLHNKVCNPGNLPDKLIKLSSRDVTLVHLNSSLTFKLPTFQCCADCPFAKLAGNNAGKSEVSLHALGFAPATATQPATGFSYGTVDFFSELRNKADVAGVGAYCS